MKAFLLVACVCVCALSVPAAAQEISLGNSWAESGKRDDACNTARQSAWNNAEVTRVSDCSCRVVYQGDLQGYRCTVYAYARELRAPTPQNSNGNIYNNPYGGTTAVFPGVR